MVPESQDDEELSESDLSSETDESSDPDEASIDRASEWIPFRDLPRNVQRFENLTFYPLICWVALSWFHFIEPLTDDRLSNFGVAAFLLMLTEIAARRRRAWARLTALLLLTVVLLVLAANFFVLHASLDGSRMKELFLLVPIFGTQVVGFLFSFLGDARGHFKWKRSIDAPELIG
jgi:hypothetical protein